MSKPAEREYLEARQRKSAEMALTVADPLVARVHQEFAEHYAARIAGQHRTHGNGFLRLVVPN